MLGENIRVNAETPFEFENDFFKGRMLFLLDSTPPNPKVTEIMTQCSVGERWIFTVETGSYRVDCDVTIDCQGLRPDFAAVSFRVAFSS